MEKPKRGFPRDFGIEYYNANEMDTYLAQKDKEIRELVEALKDAVDWHMEQGDCHCTISRIEEALNKHKTINE